jgi:hypothetical protein
MKEGALDFSGKVDSKLPVDGSLCMQYRCLAGGKGHRDTSYEFQNFMRMFVSD